MSCIPLNFLLIVLGFIGRYHAQNLTATVSAEPELIAALANASIGRILVTKDINFTQAEWNKHPRPLEITRPVSIVGTSLSVTLDMSWLKSRIRIAPSPDPPAPRAWFDVRNLTVTRVRSPAARTMAGIDLVAISPGSFQRYRDVLLIADACVPLSLVMRNGPRVERPTALPNEYGNLTQYLSMWDGAWCLPSPSEQCWPVAGRLVDFGLVALTYDTTGTQSSSGSVLYNNCTVVCRSTIPERCFVFSFDQTCFQTTLKQLGLSHVDAFDLENGGSEQPGTVSSPSPSPVQSSPGTEGPSGPPLGIILPATIAGGFAAVVIVAAAVWLLRRRKGRAGGAPPIADPLAPNHKIKPGQGPEVPLRNGSSASDQTPCPNKEGGVFQTASKTSEDGGNHDFVAVSVADSGAAEGTCGSNKQGHDVVPGVGTCATTAAAGPNGSTSSSEGQPCALPLVLNTTAGVQAAQVGDQALLPSSVSPAAPGRLLSRPGSMYVYQRASSSTPPTHGGLSGSQLPVSNGSDGMSSGWGPPAGSGGANLSQAIDSVITTTTPVDQSINMNMILGRDITLFKDTVRGVGAFGKVVEGVLLAGSDTTGSETVGLRVAVKILRGVTVTVSDKEVASMKKEVEVLSRCRHTNIVRLLGANLNPPEMFLVEELMESSLDKMIHGRQPGTELPLAQVLRIGRDVALGLAYLHPTVVHRDLKPANVLLDAQGTAKLSDFGLARLAAATLHSTCPEVGSVPYMAPESFGTNSHVVSHRADIYGLGVLIWEMLSGVRPWSGDHYMKVALAVSMRGERLPMVAMEGRAPKKLCSLVEECWQEDPYRRPSALDVAKRLTVIMQQFVEQGRPTPLQPVAPATNAPGEDKHPAATLESPFCLSMALLPDRVMPAAVGSAAQPQQAHSRRASSDRQGEPAAMLRAAFMLPPPQLGRVGIGKARSAGQVSTGPEPTPDALASAGPGPSEVMPPIQTDPAIHLKDSATNVGHGSHESASTHSSRGNGLQLIKSVLRNQTWTRPVEIAGNQ